MVPIAMGDAGSQYLRLHLTPRRVVDHSQRPQRRESQSPDPSIRFDRGPSAWLDHTHAGGLVQTLIWLQSRASAPGRCRGRAAAPGLPTRAFRVTIKTMA